MIVMKSLVLIGGNKNSFGQHEVGWMSYGMKASAFTWIPLAEVAQKEAEKKGLFWQCPHCGENNEDYPALTSAPCCAGCLAEFQWWDLLSDAEIAALRSNVIGPDNTLMPLDEEVIILIEKGV